MRAAWLTDIHLNFLSLAERQAFYDDLFVTRPDALLVGGDIGEAPSVARLLAELADAVPVPTYFVLGNHDFYGSSIAAVRRAMAELTASRPTLRYLSAAPPVELTPRTALVGHDGWADARLGDYDHSDVMLNDYLLIEELADYDRAGRRPVLEQLGDEAAAWVATQARQALARYPELIVLTHVPPFREACRYQGQVSGDEWLPHFASQALGTALVELAREFPDRQLTVLCGHTHDPADCRPEPNLRVLAGRAAYGTPTVQAVLELS